MAVGIAASPGDTHDVSDPAQFGVLGLQKIVVRKLGLIVAGDAGSREIKLHAQPFGKRAVVQVFSMPPFALCEDLRARGYCEEQ
jgi:hypothetical protein